VHWSQFSELRPIYQGCRALTFASARLSCCYRHTKNPDDDSDDDDDDDDDDDEVIPGSHLDRY